MKRIPAMAIALICTVHGSLVIAGSYLFMPILDTSTVVPDQATTFTSFANGPPVLDGVDVAFIGEFSGGHGWYKNVGDSLMKVADTSTVVPGDPSSHNFDILSAGDISISNGEVAFASGRISGGLFRGIYADVGGPLHAVADGNSTMPGSAQKFQILLFPSIDNGSVSFTGKSSGTQRGVYTDLGGMLRAVESNSVSRDFGHTAMDSGNIAFNNSLQNSGIKAEIGGVVSTISATGYYPAISGTNIAFVDDSFHAIDVDFGGGVVTLIDTSTSVPEGSGMFQSLSDVSIDGTAITFLGSDAADTIGLYTTLGGTLQKIIAEGDTLDGRTVLQVFASREALSGQNVAFAANFEDGSQVIYLATYQPRLEGDYNNDRVVDAADYVVWRKNDGTQGGYDTWRANFGQPGSSGAGASMNAAAPEPTTLVLLLFSAAGWCLQRRRAA
jgi:hypothetical protein